MEGKNKIIILFLLILQYNLVISQTKIRFDHYYTVSEGLSQGTINQIFQDSRGFMWFATQDGLNLFDGRNFFVYTYDPLDTNSLSSKFIYSISEDIEGNIWVATQNGIDKFDIKNFNVTRYDFVTEPVYSVFCTKDGNVWFQTLEAIFKFNTYTKELKKYFIGKNGGIVHRYDFGFPVVEDEKNIWFGSSFGLVQFVKEKEKIIVYSQNPSNKNTIPDNLIRGLALDNMNNLWIGTQKGLCKLDIRKKRIIQYPSDTISKRGPNVDYITGLFWSKKDLLFIATQGGGLNVYAPSQKKFFYYTHKKNESNVISYDFLLSVYEDRSFNLWVGTDGVGLCKADLKGKKFYTIKQSGANTNIPLSQNFIGSIFMENDSILWVGTWEKGLNIVNLKRKYVKYVNTQTYPDKIVGNNVHVIYKTTKNVILIGTRNGISVYLPENKKFVELDEYLKIDINRKYLRNNRIYEIKEDLKKNIWIATLNGLFRLNWQEKTYNIYHPNLNVKGSLSSKSFLSVLPDLYDSNVVWVGTQNGFSVYFYSTDSFKEFKNKKIEKDLQKNIFFTPSDNMIYHITQDLFDKNILWIGTGGGLNKFNKKDETFEYITVRDGLPNATIYEIIQDLRGYIWVSTNRGIARFDPVSKKIISFDLNDNLQALEFNNGASFFYKNKLIFFGGVDGINYFNPEKIISNPYLPNVFITSLEKVTRDGNQLKVPLLNKDSIELKYDDNSIVFYLASLEYTNPQKNKFMYYIEGLTDSWIKIGNRNFITFNNLPHGIYKLKVKASNNDELWSSNEASLVIIVKPPFYKTWWAYILYVLFFLFSIYAYVRYRVRRLEKENLMLQEKNLYALQIQKQKEELDIKNKSLIDSLNYAKKIQVALLPSIYLMKKLLPESFVLYKPKEIVSGDFYYITEKEDSVFLAVADCTGHGVPGALLSSVGIDILKYIIKVQNINEPQQILHNMHLGLLDTFSKQYEEAEIKDSIDIGIVVIDKITKTLKFSGALNDLFLLRNGSLIELEGDHYSIGTKEKKHLTFKLHTINFKQNDMIYLFTDGYVDQFGGPNNKKFKRYRFKNLLLSIHNFSLDKQLMYLEKTFNEWKGQNEQIDDILIIGVRL